MEKIAIIDLGSNSVRLVLANVMQGSYFVVFDEQKETVRLGQDIECDGFLKPARIAQAVKTLKMFRKLCDSYNVDKVIAVATSALRRAKNQKSFVEEVNSVCGFKFRVLSEEEEAIDIYRGVVNSLDVPKGVIFDISGSCIQIIQYNRRNIVNRDCLPFGSIMLSQLFSEQGYSPEEQNRLIRTYVSDQLSQIEWLKDIEPDYQLVGVGGTFRNLAKLMRRVKRYPFDMIHNYRISGEDFDTVYDMVKVLDQDKRAKIKGINSDRSDILSAALSAVKAFSERTGLCDIVVSGSELREGVMFGYAAPITMEKPLSDVLGHSIYTMMNYCEVNIPHAEQVCNLSIQLFKQLRVLHKLPRQYVKPLRIASLMHDIGTRLKFYQNNKHTFYFILNSNLYGVSHRDIILAAFIAQCHSIEDFSMADWNKYKGILLEEDLIAVMKLSVILRIAESFDRSMSGAVKTISCDVLGDSVIMKTEVEGDCSLEIKDGMKAASDFAKAYKKNLEIL